MTSSFVSSSLNYDTCSFQLFSQTMNFTTIKMGFTNISKHVIKHLKTSIVKITSALSHILLLLVKSSRLLISFFSLIQSRQPRLFIQFLEEISPSFFLLFVMKDFAKINNFTTFRDDHQKGCKMQRRN